MGSIISSWCAGFFIVSFLLALLLSVYARKKRVRLLAMLPSAAAILVSAAAFSGKTGFWSVLGTLAGLILLLFALCGVLGFWAGTALYRALEKKYS